MEVFALIFYLVVVIGIVSADSRLKKIEGHLRAMLDLQQKSLDQQRENAKALQWVVDQSKRGD
jgi:hypothetical protein